MNANNTTNTFLCFVNVHHFDSFWELPSCFADVWRTVVLSDMLHCPCGFAVLRDLDRLFDWEAAPADLAEALEPSGLRILSWDNTATGTKRLRSAMVCRSACLSVARFLRYS